MPMFDIIIRSKIDDFFIIIQLILSIMTVRNVMAALILMRNVVI